MLHFLHGSGSIAHIMRCRFQWRCSPCSTYQDRSNGVQPLNMSQLRLEALSVANYTCHLHEVFLPSWPISMSWPSHTPPMLLFPALAGLHHEL